MIQKVIIFSGVPQLPNEGCPASDTQGLAQGRLHFYIGGFFRIEAQEFNATIVPLDASGWHCARFPVGNASHGCAELSRFGAVLEVVGPPELRLAMEDLVSALAERYKQP